MMVTRNSCSFCCGTVPGVSLLIGTCAPLIGIWAPLIGGFVVVHPVNTSTAPPTSASSDGEINLRMDQCFAWRSRPHRARDGSCSAFGRSALDECQIRAVRETEKPSCMSNASTIRSAGGQSISGLVMRRSAMPWSDVQSWSATRPAPRRRGDRRRDPWKGSSQSPAATGLTVRLRRSASARRVLEVLEERRQVHCHAVHLEGVITQVHAAAGVVCSVLLDLLVGHVDDPDGRHSSAEVGG